FCSVGRMNNYATLSQNPPAKQNPAQSSREFMKHPGYDKLELRYIIVLARHFSLRFFKPRQAFYQ
ncbi:MAG: hypothetical protein L0H15_12755, partial [Nitrosospira sp.]|nr:hypothetical protein [Nitrosospira sp.]